MMFELVPYSLMEQPLKAHQELFWLPDSPFLERHETVPLLGPRRLAQNTLYNYTGQPGHAHRTRGTSLPRDFGYRCMTQTTAGRPLMASLARISILEFCSSVLRSLIASRLIFEPGDVEVLQIDHFKVWNLSGLSKLKPQR
jgi:hypothetical protein